MFYIPSLLIEIFLKINIENRWLFEGVLKSIFSDCVGEE